VNASRSGLVAAGTLLVAWNLFLLTMVIYGH
jgi:hypothetical protein